jgi:hypothetical protein
MANEIDVNAVTDATKAVSAGVKETSESIAQSAKQIVAQIESVTKEFLKYEEELKSFGVDGAKVLANYKLLVTMPQIKGFENLEKGSDIAGDTSKSFEELNAAYSKLTGGLSIPFAGAMMPLLEANDTINALEANLYAAKAATGEFGDFQKDLAEGTTDLVRELEAIDDNFLNVANASGTSLQKIRQFGLEMNSNLPSAIESTSGALQDNTKVAVTATETMDRLEATVKVALGTGMAMSAVQARQSTEFRKFNLTVQQSLENIAKLSAASKELRLPLDVMTGIVDQTADQFLYFKDNTQSLVDMMTRLGPSFKAAGLSPEAITKLSTTMVSNINQMSLAQRSFLAMQSGAAAGLRGGYQIELLKAQGKFDEIQKMTEKALKKQVGGKIVTLEEAAKDEGAARQLAKQVQLVTSGPLKSVNTEAEAYKLFESMRSGAAPGAAIKGDEALKDAVTVGGERAERQSNELVKLNNIMQKTSMSSAITAAASVKQLDFFLKGEVSNKLKNSSDSPESLLKALGVGMLETLLPTSEESSRRAAFENAAGTGPAFREGPVKKTPMEKVESVYDSASAAISRARKLPEDPLKKQKEQEENQKKLESKVGKEAKAPGKIPSAAREKSEAPVLPSVPMPVPENKQLNEQIKKTIEESAAKKAKEATTASIAPAEQVLTIVLQNPDGSSQAQAKITMKDGIIKDMKRMEDAKARRNQVGAGLA